METEKEEVFVLNGKQLTKEQFDEECKKVESNKGVHLVEVTHKEFRTRLQD